MTRSRRAENTGFACVHCATPVPANTDGHYRNHCPYCLWSLHVDELPGDRPAELSALQRVAAGGVEDAGADVQGLGRDAQRLGDLLEHLGRGTPQPALDLAQVGVGDPGLLSQLTQGELGGDALLAEVVPQRLNGLADLALRHVSTVLAAASTYQARTW